MSGRWADTATMAQAYSGPIDTRAWCAHGTVDPDSDGQRSVVFTPEYGPLVSVTLHPHDLPVRCRVASSVAGDGEGGWVPFVAGDEVIVLIPEGDERAGCVIVGRLNNEIDAWPTQVAGQDATTNTFAFHRHRTPYVLETSSNYLVRDATTAAFFSLVDGSFTVSDSDKAFFTVSPDLIGMQSGDAKCLIQIDPAKGQVTMQAGAIKLLLDPADAQLYSSGIIEIGAGGNQAQGHALTTEQFLVVFSAFLSLAAAAATTPITLAAFFATFAPPATGVTLASIVTTAATLPLSPALSAALVATFSTPSSPAQPGVGCPALLIG